MANKKIHDMNSALSAISQALEQIEVNFDKDPELAKKFLFLTREKCSEVLESWEEIKTEIR